MRKRLLFTSAAVAALCLTLLGGCGSGDDNNAAQEETSYWENQQYDTFSGSDFVEISESGGMKLLLNPASGTVRWLDTATGVYRDSNMGYTEGFMANDVQKSDVVARYFSGTKNNGMTYYATAAYDSYSMGASRGPSTSYSNLY